MFWKQPTSVIKRGIYGILLCLCFLCSYGCSIPNLDLSNKSLPSFDIDLPLIGGPELQEVAPPKMIQTLKADLATAQPKVEIIEPKQGQTLETENIDIKLNVSGLKLFLDPDLKLGPHITLILDNRAPIEVYDLNQKVTVKDLQPGSHTLRAIAEYPWHESFKNASAYDQLSFDVLTSSRQNSAGEQPILSTSSIQKTYSSEPILLDFLVRQGKINSDTEQVSTTPAKNVQVKATINDQSFTIPESEASIYIEGLEEGTNWIKLELEDSKGKFQDTAFSEQTYQFDFNPDKPNTLGKLTAGSINLQQAGVIVGRPKPVPPKPKTPPTPVPTTQKTTPEVKTTPNLSASKATNTSKPEASKPIAKPLPKSNSVGQQGNTTSKAPSSTSTQKSSEPVKASNPSQKTDTKAPVSSPSAKPLPTSRFPTATGKTAPSTTVPQENQAGGIKVNRNTAKESTLQTSRKPSPSAQDEAKPDSTIRKSPISSTAPKAEPNKTQASVKQDLNPNPTPKVEKKANIAPSPKPTPAANESKVTTKTQEDSASKVITKTQKDSAPKTDNKSGEDLSQQIKSFTQDAQDTVSKNLKSWRDRFQKMTDKSTTKTTLPSANKAVQDSASSSSSSATQTSQTSSPSEVEVVKLKVPEKS